jgi:hypothetical protein
VSGELGVEFAEAAGDRQGHVGGFGAAAAVESERQLDQFGLESA